MHPMCEYIYAHVYMSMHSLHGCEVSQIAMRIIWSWCISCVVNYFLFPQEEQHALLLQMLAPSLELF